MKNAGNEPQKNTWGNLIKNYNNNARGNVEQFSICSGDSIWDDEERRNEYIESKLALAHRNAENASQHPIFLNNLARFEQNAYANPLYKLKQSKFDKDELKSNDINLSNEQCYQVNKMAKKRNLEICVSEKKSNWRLNSWHEPNFGSIRR